MSGVVHQDFAQAMRSASPDQLVQLATGDLSVAGLLGYSDAELLEIMESGTKLLRASRFTQAVTVFRGLVALDASVPLFHMGLGLAASHAGDSDEAQAAFDESLRLAAAVEGGEALAVDILMQRAQYFLRREDLDSARADLEVVLDHGDDVVSASQRETCRDLLDKIVESPS